MTRLLDFHVHAIIETNNAPHHSIVRRDLRLGDPRRPDLAAALKDPAAHLERERQNLAAFVDAALAVDQPQWAWRLPRAAWRYLYTRGYISEIDVLLRRGLDAARRFGDESTVATCANYLASVAHRLGHRDEARGLLELAIRMRRVLGDDRAVAASIGNLSVIHESESRFTEMIETSYESLRINQRFADSQTSSGLARSAIGLGYARLGRPVPALHNFRIQLMLAVEMREPSGIAAALHHIGLVKWKAGLAGPAVARRMITAALRLNRSTGYANGESQNLGDLAYLEHSVGDTSRALGLVREAIAVAERIGHQRYEALYRAHLGEFLLTAGDVAGARASCNEAVRLARQRFPYEWALSLFRRAAVHLAEQEPEAARQLWEQALSLLNRMGVPERHDVESRLAALDGGADRLRTPRSEGRMEA